MELKGLEREILSLLVQSITEEETISTEEYIVILGKSEVTLGEWKDKGVRHGEFKVCESFSQKEVLEEARKREGF